MFDFHMKRSALFINRDGALSNQLSSTLPVASLKQAGAPSSPAQDSDLCPTSASYDMDALEQWKFLPGAIRNLYFICKNLDFELVLVTNQDKMGMAACPQDNLDRAQKKMLEILAGEGIVFQSTQIGALNTSLTDVYDLANSYLIGTRESDMQLAECLGCKFILIESPEVASNTFMKSQKGFYTFHSWDQIKELLFAGERQATVQRTTKETDILVRINLDGNGICDISTGIGFFDHLLEQIGKHGGIDLTVHVKGDLHVDEHHTIEDTAIALGEAIYQALGNKRGVERYGFCLPMDDCLCSVALDFGGRAWLIWEVDFKREKIGELPTEMIYHFFKSFSDAARMNLYIKTEGENEHHKAESIFKALARAIKAAVRRDVYKYDLPTTKGVL